MAAHVDDAVPDRDQQVGVLLQITGREDVRLGVTVGFDDVATPIENVRDGVSVVGVQIEAGLEDDVAIFVVDPDREVVSTGLVVIAREHGPPVWKGAGIPGR